ncbi:MAG: outer membrane lipoprotein carrier protein LolA [Myxococcales bacterium]|nr:outer membrane lipoprotein carrier protein LolA [Myxococcales bacterium]
MRKMFPWTILLLLAALLAPAAADPLTDLIGGIQARYGKAKDLTVDFVQTTVVKQLGNREKRADGVIYLARPDKMRWVYKTAPAKEIITDGTSLVILYVEEKKAYLSKSQGGYNIALPMSILSGEVDVKTQYTPELLPDEGGKARLKLTPKKPLGFNYLVLHINRQGFLVERIDTVDAYGNLNKIELKNPRFNTGLSTGLFSYAPKPGIEIIDAPMMDL